MRKFFALILISTLAACASLSGWEPTVDPRGTDHPENLDRDLAECKALAKKGSGGVGKESAKGIAAGAVVGTAVGVVLGAVGGDPGGGAATGAALGGVGAGAAGGMSAEEAYKRIFVNCLTGRGHRVLN